MHWISKLYRSVPDRARLGTAGITLAMLMLSAPRLLAWWLRFWAA